MWTCPTAQLKGCEAMSRFANLADKPKANPRRDTQQQIKA